VVAATDAGASADPAPPDDCAIDGGCVSKCTGQPSAICSVVSRDLLCELEGFSGASAEVACGQQVVIGTACCGGCGCVPVEVFFDGENCWEGVPSCAEPQWAGQLLKPHAPGAVDGGWTSAADNGVQGEFYLGTTPPDAGDASSEDGGSDDATPGDDATTIDASGSDGGVADADAGTPSSELDAGTGSADTGAD
jgi:hypothetical protein